MLFNPSFVDPTGSNFYGQCKSIPNRKIKFHFERKIEFSFLKNNLKLRCKQGFKSQRWFCVKLMIYISFPQYIEFCSNEVLQKLIYGLYFGLAKPKGFFSKKIYGFPFEWVDFNGPQRKSCYPLRDGWSFFFLPLTFLRVDFNERKYSFLTNWTR